MAAEAARIVAAMDAKSDLARVTDMEEWLASLGPLVAGNISVEDARAKLAAYCGMLEYPAACFTKASLAKAAKRFKFFPTFSELTEFLDAQHADLRVKRQRLEAIVRAAQGNAPKAIAHEPIDYSPEAQERVRQWLAAAGMGLKMPGGMPQGEARS